MKKAIWINPLSTCSTSLDTLVNPHDVESLALSSMLEKQGYEVWLHEPYKVKKSQSRYRKKIFHDQLRDFKADMVLVNMGTFYVSYINKFYKADNKAFNDAMDFLINYEGPLYIFVTDPRKDFMKMFDITRDRFKPKDEQAERYVDKIMDIFTKAKLIVPTDLIVSEDKRDRCVTAEYWKLLDNPIYDFNESYDYNSVYVGVKNQTTYRKKLVTEWMKDDPMSYTAGPINLKGIESLTDYNRCTFEESLNYAKNSKTVLACSEANHYWLTPRLIQSLVNGSIASIHPELPCRHLLPQDILDEQTFGHISEFDDRLLNKDVYQRQVEFVSNLKNTVKEINIP
jgi:hypothetical protein